MRVTTATNGYVEPQLVITRTFDAPREQVFRAWADPEHLKRWFAPTGCTISYPELDLREGGVFRSCLRTPQGYDCWCKGVYLEIVVPERIVYTVANTDENGNPAAPEEVGKDPDWPTVTTVTVTFEEHGGGTKLTLHQTAPESVARRTGAYGGWLDMLDRLAEDLAVGDPELLGASTS